MDKVLFCNLDGTLIETRSGRPYPLHSQDWKFIDKTLECINHYHKKGYLICIISNQDGVAAGYVHEDVFIAKIEDVCKRIEKHLSIPVNTINYVYCTDLESFNHKPKPGMAYEFAIDREADLRGSVMVGDSDVDKDFAFNAGIGKYMNLNEVVAVHWSNLKR